MLSKNIAANYLGVFWPAFLSLALVPVYIRYMGVEAYGLIGFFVLLQGWLALLDLGLSPTLNRETARYAAGEVSSGELRDLLRSIELISLLMISLACAAVVAASNWFAVQWFNVESLEIAELRQAIMLMSVVAFMRFMETIYSSCLLGLQRQLILSFVLCVSATVRGLGAVVVVVFVSADIVSFFFWQAIAAVLSLATLSFVAYRCMPAAPRSGRFSGAALGRVWKYSAGMVGVSVVSFAAMQIDKLILSSTLPLEEFGHYALAGAVISVLYMACMPIFRAYFPRFVALVGEKQHRELKREYHEAAQLVAVCVGASAIALIVFAEPLLNVWTQNHELAAEVAPIVSVLALGSLLHAMMITPYQLQLAHGWTSLAIKLNVIVLFTLTPLLFVVIPIYGGLGAAWVWVCVNVLYISLGSFWMHRRIYPEIKKAWLLNDVVLPLVPPIVLGIIAALLKSELFGGEGGSQAVTLLLVVVSWVAILLSSVLFSSRLRPKLIALLASLASRPNFGRS